MIKIVEPRKGVKFEIRREHCKTAERCNPCECVIARAFQDKFSDTLLEVQVLPKVTSLVFSGGLIHRYRTSDVLREALTAFDDTGKWNLSEGSYELEPLPKHMTAAHIRSRAAKRREAGDKNMDKKYAPTGRATQRKINPRIINLKAMRVASEGQAKA